MALFLESGYRAAGTLRRLVAGGLDLAIESALCAGGFLLLFPADAWPPRYWNWGDYCADLLWNDPDLVGRVVSFSVGVVVVWEVLWTRLIGQTPVARLLRMRVVTSSGRRPGLIRIAIRALIAIAGTLAGLFGPLLAFVHPQRRMLHDMITGCHVLVGPVPIEERRTVEPSLDRGRPFAGPYRDGPRR